METGPFRKSRVRTPSESSRTQRRSRRWPPSFLLAFAARFDQAMAQRATAVTRGRGCPRAHEAAAAPSVDELVSDRARSLPVRGRPPRPAGCRAADGAGPGSAQSGLRGHDAGCRVSEVDRRRDGNVDGAGRCHAIVPASRPHRRAEGGRASRGGCARGGVRGRPAAGRLAGARVLRQALCARSRRGGPPFRLRPPGNARPGGHGPLQREPDRAGGGPQGPALLVPSE